MAEFPALPIWTDAYKADCSHLSDAEHGRYFLLLVDMWRAPDCRLPNDDEWLARKFGRTVEQFKALFRPLINEFCKCDGNWITQKRLSRERAYVTQRSKQQSERAKSRWEKDKDTCPGNAGAAMPPHPHPHPHPDKNKKEESKGHSEDGAIAPLVAKRSFLLPDWVPKEAWQDFEEMRAKIRKPMTDRARNLIIGKLDALVKSGCDPRAVLLQSVENSWQTIYPLRENNHGKNRGYSGQPTKDERAKAAIVRSVIAGGYAPQRSGSEAGAGDNGSPLLLLVENLRKGTGSVGGD